MPTSLAAEVFNGAAGIESIGHTWILRAQRTAEGGFAKGIKSPGRAFCAELILWGWLGSRTGTGTWGDTRGTTAAFCIWDALPFPRERGRRVSVTS